MILRRLRDERGTAALELGLIMPLFLIMLMLFVPLVTEGWDYLVITGATAHGVRYASRVDENARTTSTFAPTCAVSGPTRRPNVCEVQQFVRQAASPVPVSVTVSPDPSISLPGEPITVTTTYTVNFPMASAVNWFTAFFFGSSAAVPTSTVINIAGQGREE